MTDASDRQKFVRVMVAPAKLYVQRHPLRPIIKLVYNPPNASCLSSHVSMSSSHSQTKLIRLGLLSLSVTGTLREYLPVSSQLHL